jgi:hypothetical protein
MFDNIAKRSTLSALLLLWICGFAISGMQQPAHASSVVIDGPGFKVEKKRGWFGRKSTSYTDMMGNTVEKRTGFFGRTSTRTKLFGNEARKSGNNVQVLDANGKPLVTTRNTIFHGKQTHVDGNGIFQSIKDMFK